jgi:Family of unknown function (DUF6069)
MSSNGHFEILVWSTNSFKEGPMLYSTRRNLIVIGSGAAAALAVWTLFRLIGVEPTVGKGEDVSSVGPIDVAIAAFVAGLGAWFVYTLLARRRLVHWWPFIGSTALAISMIGPSYQSDGASAMALMCMHFAVGIVLIAGLMGRLPRWFQSRNMPITY